LVGSFLGLVCLVAPIGAAAQPAIRKQATDSAPPQAMTPAELAQLGDPLFVLVLKTRPQETRLDEIERLLMGTSGQRHLFVVHEDLQDPTRGRARRAVTAYSGSNQSVRLDPNVTLSLVFTDQGFDPDTIEAWGWDDRQSRYNYYKLDGQPPSWKFRGSSVGADQLAPAQRQGTCMACHINGAPIMKELPFPWNNWHSFRNVVGHLLPGTPDHWAVAESARFRDLKGAQDLERAFILPSIRQFNGRRITALTRSAPGGLQEVTDGPRLLRPLFQTTEYNIISSGQLSGLHPLPTPGTGPGSPVGVPDTFFLNANLLAGGGATQYEGLGVAEARRFANLLTLQPAEYRGVVEQFRTRLGNLPGDTNFAWFVPEPSHSDNQMVDLLVRRGVITREFAAAVFAVDLERPVFSPAREGLLALVPGRFRFKPINPGDVPAAHPDELTGTVIAALRALNPVAGSAQADLLALLENPKPVDVLRQRVVEYLERVNTRLSDSQQRGPEVARLYQIMLDRRQEAARRIPTLVESPRLFPAGQAP
jgi:hypothetical protein